MRAPSFHLAFTLLFVSLLAPVFGAPAQAQNTQQQPIPVPKLDPGTLGQPGFQFSRGVPAVVNLIPHGDGARGGHVWIGNTGKSLRIVGEVDGSAPDWPKDKNSILSKDHVEVWLTAASDVEMQPFERLFVRQWLLGGDQSVEAYATPAYETLRRNTDADFSALKPHGEVTFLSGASAGKAGYTFEIDIPYSSFPPLKALQVSELHLMVDVFSAAPAGKREGAYSTSTAMRAFGRPETFNLLRLQPPLAFDTSPCHSPLESEKYVNTEGFAQKFPAWFIPSGAPGSYQTNAFLVGYWSDHLELSVYEVFPFHYFWRALGTTEWVCGPDLAYRNGNTIRNYASSTARVDGYGENLSEIGFDAKRAPDGRILIEIGPRVWNPNSNAQCGRCPITELKMLALDSNLNLITSLQLGKQIGGLSAVDESGNAIFSSSQDFSVSPDWSRIVEYDQTGSYGAETWSSVTYCLDTVGYRVCDEKKEGVTPPNPPVIRQHLLDQN